MSDRILGPVLRPNPPRLVTLALAVALVVIGVSATIFPIDFVSEALALVQAGVAIEVTPEIGWLCLLAANLLLIAGSLLPGI
jgi:heme/copper-type cytochrome/quinol oxidase subunit 1